ncbi:hypothetical protein DLE60_27975 [Micromonospora globispora]|uniref:PEP/pyruvate-binding domain-containing protein n=1 Tax=Micromonospora globispora TaxID=1450148 RepID=UPI000D6F772F|nr:PEP/pyruvate-binding domain-containing protein [Micromonospora globispora]PWU55442.1 hypothetical protein DLE60_27975 [Micromonospora globispora]RQW91841.1 hypothetical protein DKL51_20345 [Micromonospora globispora]
MIGAATMYTATFDSERCRDAREVGGKAHGLAVMTSAGLPVAPGFTLTAQAFRDFIEQGTLRRDITALLDEADPADPTERARVEQQIAALMTATPIPAAVADEVTAAYHELCRGAAVTDVPVAVRSSATAEDSAGDSFAGEFETWVDVVGAAEVVAHVHRCYASVYGGRVLAYALERGVDLHTVEMAVVVQKTVRARSAGVMFTLDPITGDRSRIVLESCWGLGLAVVGGEVTPDRFIVNKVGLTVVDRVPGDKRIEYRRGDAPTEVPADRRYSLSLDDAEVTALAQLGKRLERLNGGPQDIEFAIDGDLPAGGNLILLQCRPETVWANADRAPAFEAGAGFLTWITGSISGAASASGPVHNHD